YGEFFEVAQLPSQHEVKGVELDEMWTYVGNKEQKRWVWLARDRNSPRIIGMAVGDRSAETGQILWESIPESVRKRAKFYTDRWDAYDQFVPDNQCISDHKQTNHVERINNTFRQRIARLVRRTLSFSKCQINLECQLKFYIMAHNASL
ncbi:MAG: IS1 family transposase, partial [Bacteroidota bacterium]